MQALPPHSGGRCLLRPGKAGLAIRFTCNRSKRDCARMITYRQSKGFDHRLSKAEGDPPIVRRTNNMI